MIRFSSLAAGLLLAGACSGPSGNTREIWAADLPNEILLIMTLHFQDGEVTGTGLLAPLGMTGGDALTITGTRRADTLDLHYQRGQGDPMRFQGWYIRNKAALDGILDGGEFVQRPVSFRRR
jgi:hypothetical protein